MILKLESIGVKGTELEWFKKFLKCRKQSTKFKGQISGEKVVPIGLPQGTSLSVILFILYIDSLTKVPQYGSVILFAGDTPWLL